MPPPTTNLSDGLASCEIQAPQATGPIAHDTPADAIVSALTALQPIQSAGVAVEIQRKGPFVGGGYGWSVAFKPVELSPDGDEYAALLSTFPTIGVQQANVTGTGARVRVERRDAHEAPAVEQLVSLAAPLPAETAEMQVVGCSLVGMAPSEAAQAGVSLVLVFRGERTEVTSLLTDREFATSAYAVDIVSVSPCLPLLPVPLTMIPGAYDAVTRRLLAYRLST